MERCLAGLMLLISRNDVQEPLQKQGQTPWDVHIGEWVQRLNPFDEHQFDVLVLSIWQFVGDEGDQALQVKEIALVQSILHHILQHTDEGESVLPHLLINICDQVYQLLKYVKKVIILQYLLSPGLDNIVHAIAGCQLNFHVTIFTSW